MNNHAQIQVREGTEGKTLSEKQAWYAKLLTG